MSNKRLTIVKFGGKIFESETILQTTLSAFAKIKGTKILVHGGGPEANELSEKLDIKPKKIMGRRITDAATLKVVTMVYAGWLNKQVVSLLQSDNCNALGLSGADLNLIQCEKRKMKSIDFGFVGDIQSINVEMLFKLLEMNITPVFNAITHDGKGQLLNTNADTIAAHLASALSSIYKVHLYYCFDKKGVLENAENDSNPIPQIDTSNYQTYQNDGVITDGMIPKIDNAFFALANKVAGVYIGHFDALGNIENFKGTQICQ